MHSYRRKGLNVETPMQCDTNLYTKNSKGMIKLHIAKETRLSLVGA